MRGSIFEVNPKVLGRYSTVCSFTIFLILAWRSRYSLEKRGNRIRWHWSWNRGLRKLLFTCIGGWRISHTKLFFLSIAFLFVNDLINQSTVYKLCTGKNISITNFSIRKLIINIKKISFMLGGTEKIACGLLEGRGSVPRLTHVSYCFS